MAIKKVLQILETAYRCTLEEQDEPVVWLTTVIRGAGADTDLLLRGNAVNYAVAAQDAAGLRIGGIAQREPPRLPDDLARLRGVGARIFVTHDDLRDRGIGDDELIEGIEPIARESLPRLLGNYDQVWHW